MDSKLYSFRAPGPLAKVIDAQDSKTDFINGCIADVLSRQYHLQDLGDVCPVSALPSVEMPFFDISMVAGFPIPLDNDERAQNIDLLRMLVPHPDASYLIRVQGSSMIDAGIHSGDLLIVDKSNRNPTPSEVAVCELNGEYTIKHFVRRDGCGWLVPANPDYPEIQITPDDSFSIWGVVTYVIHKPIDNE